MTKLLEQAIDSIRQLPDEEQYGGRYRLTDEQAAQVDLARREVREGKIVTEAEMDEVWRRFGR